MAVNYSTSLLDFSKTNSDDLSQGYTKNFFGETFRTSFNHSPCGISQQRNDDYASYLQNSIEEASVAKICKTLDDTHTHMNLVH